MPLISPTDRSQQTDEVRRIREEYNDREVENKKKHRQDIKRLSSGRKSELEKIQKKNDELIEEVKDKYKEDLGDKDRKNSQEISKIRSIYLNSLRRRSEEDMRGIQSERVAHEEIRDRQKPNQQRLEKQHILEEYQAREEDLVRQRDESVDIANQLTRERVSGVVKNLNKQISELDRRHRIEKSQSHERFQETLAEQEKTFKKQLELTQNNADARLKRYINSSQVDQPHQEVKIQDEIKNMQESYSQNLSNQKEAQVKLFKEVFGKLSKKMKVLQDSFTKKHETTVDFYESKMQDLEYQHRKEIERLNRSHDILSRQKEQAAKIEEETISQKYEAKISNQSDLHQREVDRLEKRHREHLQVAIMKLAAQLKKA